MGEIAAEPIRPHPAAHLSWSSGPRGTVGSEVTRALLDAGAHVRILTRFLERKILADLPDTSG